jgi:hypothetical protein
VKGGYVGLGKAGHQGGWCPVPAILRGQMGEGGADQAGGKEAFLLLHTAPAQGGWEGGPRVPVWCLLLGKYKGKGPGPMVPLTQTSHSSIHLFIRLSIPSHKHLLSTSPEFGCKINSYCRPQLTVLPV